MRAREMAMQQQPALEQHPPGSNPIVDIVSPFPRPAMRGDALSGRRDASAPQIRHTGESRYPG